MPVVDLRSARFLWGAFVISVMALFLVSRLIPASAVANETMGPVLSPALTLVALSNLGLSFVLPRFLPNPRAARLLALALCESAAILGLMLHLAAGWANAWTLFAAALAGLALHYPRPR